MNYVLHRAQNNFRIIYIAAQVLLFLDNHLIIIDQFIQFSMRHIH